MLVAAAAAALGTVAADLSPSQVHIAFAGARNDGSPDGMNVAWFTEGMAVAPMVQYGVSETLSTNTTAIGGAHQYISDCNDPCGYHYHAELSGLEAGQVYYYRVGDSSADVWSQTFSFRAAPSTSAEFQPFGVSVWGDMGWLGSTERPVKVAADGLKKNWTAVPTRSKIESMKNSGKIDFVWHVGDIAYADDAFASEPLRFNYENVYNGFMEWFQNVSSTMPYMVSVGNHESECHSPACALSKQRIQGLSNFSAYNARWHMPSASSNGVLNMWYSFNYGPIHFVSLNSETDFPGAGEENKGDSGAFPAGHFARDGEYLAWLEADLKAAADPAQRAVRPWIIAGAHRPFGEISRNGVEEMFSKYGVDLYFAGHTHSYVRSLPIVNGSVELQSDPNHYHASNGTTLIVTGGAGCDEMQDMLQSTTPKHELNDAAAPYGSQQVATSRLSVGMFRMMNRSALRWTLYSSHTGETLDDLWITK